MEGKIRVLIVDDHQTMRAVLRAFLNRQPDMEVVGEASDGVAGVEAAHELSPDVVLMDITMPQMDGVQATSLIHTSMPGVRVIGLSMQTDEEAGASMQRAGAAAYLSKDSPPGALLQTVRTVAA